MANNLLSNDTSGVTDMLQIDKMDKTINPIGVITIKQPINYNNRLGQFVTVLSTKN